MVSAQALIIFLVILCKIAANEISEMDFELYSLIFSISSTFHALAGFLHVVDIYFCEHDDKILE